MKDIFFSLIYSLTADHTPYHAPAPPPPSPPALYAHHPSHNCTVEDEVSWDWWMVW